MLILKSHSLLSVSKEYASSLLLNGYQTADDLIHLQEKHLTELNITDPEHRQRLLAVANVYYEIGGERPVSDSQDFHFMEWKKTDFFCAI